MKYKVIAHRSKLSTTPLCVKRYVERKNLAAMVYGLVCEFPGCCISMYPELSYVVEKEASIAKQLQTLLDPASTQG